MIKKDRMLIKFSLYGFLKNLRFFDPFIILIFRAGGLSFLQIGFLYSIRDVATNILEIPTGVYADVLGRRHSLVLAFSAYILSFVIFYFFSSFLILAAGMIFFACGEAFRSGTHKALIMEYLDLNQMSQLKVSYYGRTRSASQLGSALNALIAAGMIFITGDYKLMFLISTIPYTLDLFNVATYPRELDGNLIEREKGAVAARFRTTFRDFKGMFTDRQVMRAIFNSSSFNAVFKSSKDYLQPILAAFALSVPLWSQMEDMRREAIMVGLVYFGLYLLTSYASRRAGRFSDRFKDLAQAVNLSFLAGAVLLLLAGAASWSGAGSLSITAFIALYFLYNLRKPVNVGLIGDKLATRVMASGLSVESQFTTLIMAAVAPLLGFLADAYQVGAGLSAVGAGMFVVFFLVRVE